MRERPAIAEEWFDDLAEGIVLVRSGRIVGMNRAASELLGVAREGAIGRPLMLALRDHRVERVWREGAPADLTVRGRSVRVEPIRGGLSLRDVDEARVASEHARELLAVLSHELRTPLTTVKSTLDALAYDDLPATTRASLLARAASEAERLVRLLNDLTVDVAPPRERTVPLREAAERALAVLAPVLDARAVRVRHHLPDLTVWVDPDKLVQVLINLLENAAVHGPREADVELSARAENGWASVVVRDRGEPLPADRFPRLFAPHARGGGATGPGTGLGLYVVASIADRWGGRAWGAPTRPDGGGEGEPAGNEFGVLVPLAKDVPPPPDAGTQASAEVARDVPLGEFVRRPGED